MDQSFGVCFAWIIITVQYPAKTALCFCPPQSDLPIIRFDLPSSKSLQLIILKQNSAGTIRPKHTTLMSHIRPSIPPELIDLIIDASAKDTEALMTFALISKPCVPRCRRYLFRSIDFSTDRGEDILNKRHESFRLIITRDPQIQTYVQKLVVRDIEMSCAPLPWMITNTRFHETLCLLGPHIKRFIFIADSYEWASFPPSFKLAFMSIFTSPFLTSIRLQGLEAIPRACCVAFGSSQVADLTIVTSNFSDTVDPDLPVVTENSFIPQNLSWLHLEDVDEKSIDVLLDAWIPTSVHGHDRPLFPCLTALSIAPTDEDTIQYFYWDYAYGSQARPLNTQPLNLSILKKLFAIKYEVTFYPDDEVEAMHNPPDHFNGLISLLQSVKPGTIQQLDVKVDFKNFGDAVESLQYHDGWSGLDHVLSSEAFDQIHEFILQLDIETLFREDDISVDTDLTARKAEIDILIKTRLPSLSTINSYVFIFTVEHQRI
ncbi:hypothetical protein C0995_003351 [Termitomyces sp. Mi166|nr:hypothetical protein C0995_003351 [Termitomyces sp. Mi166\